MSHAQIAAALAAAVAKGAHPAVAPIGASDDYMINEVLRDKEAPPAAHPGWTEVHLILDGKAVLVVGGKVVDGGGKPAMAIEGGTRHTVVKGDVVVVPPDTPHWYTQIESPIVAIEVRFKSGKIE
jgi:mannose-6-phosphate isomerase-like protein (cupin superfamily)